MNRFAGCSMNKQGFTIHRKVTDETWLALCNKSDAATFFHTPYWAAVFTNRFPGRFWKNAHVIEDEHGEKVLIPIVMKRHLFGMVNIACSMPGGTFGGPVFTDSLQRGMAAEVHALLQKFPDIILRENPYQQLSGGTPWGTVVNDPTQVINCEEGYDAAWKRATAAHRNAVRNAIKARVEISAAQHTDDWDAYVAIYGSSIDRWKDRNIFSGVSYDREFFRLIEKLDPKFRRLFIAKVNGVVVAGILCFYWNRHCVVWHGAGRAEHFGVHPNNLLYDRALQYAVESGYRWFDCNPSGNLSGVFKFKQYFGAQPLNSRVFIKRSVVTSSIDMFRNRIRSAR